MLLSAGSVVFVFINPIFYVTNAEVGGLRYVPADEIYSSSGIANQHILFIDPDIVRQNLLLSPSLSSARVGIEWPARVVIVVREREPALVWEQGGERYWVDVNGNLMALRTEIKELVRVVNEGANIPFHCPGPDCPEGQDSAITIDPAVILGAQQLKTLRANIEVL
jgi:cell division septal protein FtsQ